MEETVRGVYVGVGAKNRLCLTLEEASQKYRKFLQYLLGHGKQRSNDSTGGSMRKVA